jgi:restriction system protein
VGCEVKRCGRTGDGGIDLLIINCDTPIAVQVRRRMTSQKVETVYPVREFLGACLLKGHRELIYVTTARFSRGAANAANEAVKVELVRKYDLVDGEQFMSMLNLASTRRCRSS